MKNNKIKKQRNKETEEDKIIDIMCKLGGGLIEEKNNQKNKKRNKI